MIERSSWVIKDRAVVRRSGKSPFYSFKVTRRPVTQFAMPNRVTAHPAPQSLGP